MSTLPSIEEQLQNLLALTLDDVITTNRDHAELRIATKEDIAALPTAVDDFEAVTGEISRWSLIALELRDDAGGVGVSVYLVGYNETTKSSWMTSRVLSIDEDAQLLTTHSGSLYRLVGACTTNVDIPFICAMLNRWGIGEHLGLPPFFF